MNKKDIEYKALKILEDNPELSQRAVAKELGISLGKTHYVVRALIEKGFIKLGNFRRSSNKKGYVYLLTSRGILEKSEMASAFLTRKEKEYVALKHEIDALKEELKY